MRRIPPIAALLLAAAPLPASAASSEVAVERLSELDPSARQGRFDFVVRELAMSISGPPSWAVGALGLYEFEVTTGHRLAFLHVDEEGPGTSAWQDLAASGDPGTIGYMPTFLFRKGLPWSFEVGGEAGWLASTRQFLVGGYGRWAVSDGWDRVPDAAVQLGYEGYVGNDQLDLGVFELDLSIGYSFRVGSRIERPGTRFSPYAGYGLLMAHARPMAGIGQVAKVSAWLAGASAGVDPRDFRFHRFFGGMEILSGHVAFGIGADVTVPREGPVLGAFTISLGARL